MYVPIIFKKSSDKIPKVLKDYQHVGKAYQENGYVGQAFQDVIKLGTAVGTSSGGGSHVSSQEGLCIRRCTRGNYQFSLIISNYHGFSKQDCLSVLG